MKDLKINDSFKKINRKGDNTMSKQSNFSYINEAIEKFQDYFSAKVEQNEINLPIVRGKRKVILYMSIGNPKIRAKVVHTIANTVERAFSRLADRAVDLVRKQHVDPAWLKFDIVSEIEEVSFQELEEKVKNTRRYYFRNGIALDEEFRVSFLEQEINGNVMIKYDKQKVLHLNEKHIKNYMKQRYPQALPFLYSRYKQLNPTIYLFKTKAVFMNREDKVMHELLDGDLSNGIRKVNDIEEELKTVVDTASTFLKHQLK